MDNQGNNQQQLPTGGNDNQQQPNQRPVGDPPAAPGAGDPQSQQGNNGDEPLGEAGKRALNAERTRVRELEQRLSGLAPLVEFVEQIRAGKAVADDQKTDTERLQEQIQQLQADAAAERLGRLRLEVATEAALPPELAARLNGTTREELAADAAALKALIPAPESTQGGPRRPAPDPTQGGRGAPPDLSAQIAAAEQAGDWQLSMRLKNQQMSNQ